MSIPFGAVSHLLGTLAYLILAIFFIRSRYARHTDHALITACTLTAIWSLLIALQQIGLAIPFEARYSLEVIHNAAWMRVLFSLLGIRVRDLSQQSGARRQLALGVYGLILVMLAAGALRAYGSASHYISAQLLIVCHLALSLMGLILLEQVWTNVRGFNRSGTKFLGIALAGFFIYDGALYTDAMMQNAISPVLWDARGAIHALLSPLIGLTLINAKRQPLGVQISREFVFRGTVMVLAGLYLIFVALAAWLVQAYGTGWSDTAAVFIMAIATVALLLVATSARMRARIQIFLGKHFFDYKYDYRDEWLKATRQLSLVEEDMDSAVINVLAQTVSSPGGMLWLMNEKGHFDARRAVNQPLPRHGTIDADADILVYFQERDWIVNLEEYEHDPTRYHLMEIPEPIWASQDPWLIIPLHTPEGLIGLVVLQKPIVEQALNWENYDLLRIVARQATSYLALYNAQQALTSARQFEAVSQASAFLVHDLKTIIAQLSLLLKNAERHKSNPAFIDDMLKTTSHAVQKMSRIVEQVRKPVQQEHRREVDIIRILREAVTEAAKRQPAPELSGELRPALTVADAGQLKSVFTHIITNAQDATPKDGEIQVSVKQSPGWVVVFIQDNGKGMDPDFVQNELFRPFASTKGVSGMGIGVYQSKAFLSRMGGDMEVSSEVGVGSIFTLKIPTRSRLAHQASPQTDSAGVKY
ncbi:MAG: PEP-CTERM system histidine kinase PrsK [Gammaproteobacteria bacterium]|nr:MAG: PEP-CTERM system histidine kinase PrsK [Gammaproteobacteria bacterium]